MPTLFVRYCFGEWRANGLPDQNIGSSNRALAIDKIRGRALLVGGSGFANELTAALRDSAVRGELNRATYAGRGNLAGQAPPRAVAGQCARVESGIRSK